MKMRVLAALIVVAMSEGLVRAQPPAGGAAGGAQPPAGRGGQAGGRGGAGAAPARGGGGAPNLGQPPSDTPGKSDIVVVTGCLRLQGTDNWMVTAATDPLTSVANAPQRSEMPTTPPAGKNQFKLIGVGEFDLPSHRDKTVVIKALYIKAMPVSRLNVTSLVDAVPTCAPDAPK